VREAAQGWTHTYALIAIMTSVLVILDTTALVADRFLEGNAMRLLLQQRSMGRLRIAIPELVLLEVANRVREEAATALAEILSGHNALRRLRSPASGSALDVSAEVAATDYETLLRRKLADNEVEVLPLPTTPHRLIVDRALGRRRPFDQKGQGGYRDTLIWECVRLAAQMTDSQIHFVSANYRDYAESGRGSELAKALQREVRADLFADGGPDPRVVLVENVQVLMESQMQSAPETAQQLQELLNRDKGFQRVTFTTIEQKLDNESLVGSQFRHDAAHLDLGDDFEPNSASLHVVEPGVTHVTISSAQNLTNDLSLLEIYVEVDAEVNYSFMRRSLQGLTIKASDTSDDFLKTPWLVSGVDVLTLGVNLEATFNRRARRIEATHIIDATGL
jgi:PIN domain